MPDQKNFCENCGNPLNPGARFCQGCGQPISAGPSPGQAPFPPSPSPSPEIVKRTRGFLPWILGGLALVAVGGGLGGYYWGKFGDSPSPPSQVQEVPPSLPKPSNGPDITQEFVPLPPPPAPEPTPSYSETGPGWPWTSQRLVTRADLAGLSSGSWNCCATRSLPGMAGFSSVMICGPILKINPGIKREAPWPTGRPPTGWLTGKLPPWSAGISVLY